MKALGRAQVLALGMAFLGVATFCVESQATEPTRSLRLPTRATQSSTTRVMVFKGNSQDQLLPAPAPSDPAPANAAPPSQLSLQEVSDALASAGVSIQPTMLSTKKPFTLTPATPRLANGAQLQFMGVYQGNSGPSGPSQNGAYYFQNTGGVRDVQLYVPPSALVVGKTYLVDFAIHCAQAATWRVYVSGGGQEMKLQAGAQHIPVLVTWMGPSANAFNPTLMNLGAAWTFYSAKVTEL